MFPRQSAADCQARVDGLFSDPRDPLPPISTLQQLRLVDQVVSLTNFHYNVQMREGVTDSFLVEALRSFNNNKGERQFNSVYDGVSTRLMHPPPTPRSRSPPRTRVFPSCHESESF